MSWAKLICQAVRLSSVNSPGHDHVEKQEIERGRFQALESGFTAAYRLGPIPEFPKEPKSDFALHAVVIYDQHGFGTAGRNLLVAMIDTFARDRKIEIDRGPFAESTFDIDKTFVVLDNSMYDTQPQSGASLSVGSFGRKEGFENVAHDFRGIPDPVSVIVTFTYSPFGI